MERKVLTTVQVEVYGETISGFENKGKIGKHNDLKGLLLIILDESPHAIRLLKYSNFPSHRK